MSFERLRVYRAAQLLDVMVLALVAAVPHGHAKDIDQLKRASAAILYNIAEAWGSLHQGQKIYHLGIARGSADEVRAVLSRLVAAGALTTKVVQRPSILARTIAKMLSSWIEALTEAG